MPMQASAAEFVNGVTTTEFMIGGIPNSLTAYNFRLSWYRIALRFSTEYCLGSCEKASNPYSKETALRAQVYQQNLKFTYWRFPTLYSKLYRGEWMPDLEKTRRLTANLAVNKLKRTIPKLFLSQAFNLQIFLRLIILSRNSRRTMLLFRSATG